MGELTSWSVALMSKSERAESIHAFSNEIKVGCFIRNRAKDVVDPNTYYIRKNHIVGNQCDEFIDLDKDLLSEALEETKRRKKEKQEKNGIRTIRLQNLCERNIDLSKLLC